MPQTLWSCGGTHGRSSICAQCSTCRKILCHGRNSQSSFWFKHEDRHPAPALSSLPSMSWWGQSHPGSIFFCLSMVGFTGILGSNWELICSVNAISHHQHTGGRWKLILQHLISCHCWKDWRADKVFCFLMLHHQRVSRSNGQIPQSQDLCVTLTTFCHSVKR